MFKSTHDLSEITEALVTVLNTTVQAWPLWTKNGGVIPYYTVSVTSSSPDNLREAQEGECQLSLYLLHVGQDPFFRNTPVLGTGAMANTQQPLSLNLTYLATAFSADNADREQQIMSIALSTFHEQPIYIGSGPDAGAYLTVSLGTDTLSEMSALWQSFACAYRLSTIYRVAVAFLTPSTPPTAPYPNPTRAGFTVAPALASFDATPQLYQPARQVAFTVPADKTLEEVTTTVASLAAAGGADVMISGQGLDTIDSITLATLDGLTSWPMTARRSDSPPLGAEMVLSLPATYAIGAAAATPPPATTPPPGVYLLTVAKGAAVSLAIPLTIQPRFDNVPAAAVLHAAGGVYSFSGGGFVPGATQLFVDGALLAAGAVDVAPDGTAVTFSLAATQPAGTFALRVRVDGVDAPATWQVQK